MFNAVTSTAFLVAMSVSVLLRSAAITASRSCPWSSRTSLTASVSATPSTTSSTSLASPHCVVFVRGRRNGAGDDKGINGKVSKPFSVALDDKEPRFKHAEAKTSGNLSSLFKPVTVLPNPDDINVGEEIAGKLNKQALLKTLNLLHRSAAIKALAKEHGMDDYIYHQAFISFRKFCLDVKSLPTDLYVLISDVLQGGKHINDIFPFFLSHARKVFPHLECIEDLRVTGDLTDPPNWYPEARAMNRKVIFHAGPTNSGKTYHALERFSQAKTGIYCGPLKLLAVEVFNKTNDRGVDCDLVTGEERRFARSDSEPSEHVACTVEMANFSQNYEVAVIDEIQMIKDFQRGWAWTRSLLGIPAEEIHVCGEVSRGEFLEYKYVAARQSDCSLLGRCHRSNSGNDALHGRGGGSAQLQAPDRPRNSGRCREEPEKCAAGRLHCVLQ